ncbi:hypothetical protein BaRGS_00036667, partial [Batillaria attramentaria]
TSHGIVKNRDQRLDGLVNVGTAAFPTRSRRSDVHFPAIFEGDCSHGETRRERADNER